MYKGENCNVYESTPTTPIPPQPDFPRNMRGAWGVLWDQRVLVSPGISDCLAAWRRAGYSALLAALADHSKRLITEQPKNQNRL
jgi:hypothetical protein